MASASPIGIPSRPSTSTFSLGTLLEEQTALEFWLEKQMASAIYVSHKVEKILKGNLDSIPSPSTSVKIQIIGGKVYLRCKGKTLLVVVNKLLKPKMFDDITQQCFALLPQVKVPANNLNFH
jgi:hypothetical protein